MKKIFSSLAMVGAVFALSACTVTCDHVGEYDGKPYNSERTAGSGTESDADHCHIGGNRESYTYSDERTKASDGQPQTDSSLE